MSYFEDFLFWKLGHFFIVEEEYRIVSISKDHKELWLEKKENKKYPVIRLLRYDLDWGNWLERDLQRTAANGEGIRKSMTRGGLNVLNIYVSQYPPVDDYQFRIEHPVVHSPSNKTKVETILIDSERYEEKVGQLESLFSRPIQVNSQLEYGPSPEEIDLLRVNTLKTAIERSKAEQAIFSVGKPIFTYIFMAIQLIVFVIMEYVGSTSNSETLIQFGAKFNPLILEGEWWRFITPIFIHIGFYHLFMNTISLFYIGGIVERIYGSFRFFIIYIIAGLGGSVASFIFSSNISAGASGAIFGCFGALLYFGMLKPKLFLRTMGINIFAILALNLAFGFTVSGIDNAGHIGGLIGGFLAAGIVSLPKTKKIVWKLMFALATMILFASFIQYGFANPSAVVDEPTTLLMSQQYIDEGKYQEAYDLLTISELDFSNSSSYYFILSYAEIQLGNIEDAKESLLKAIELDPNFHEAHYNLALVYLQLGNLEDAIYHAEEAVKIRPNNDDYRDLIEQLQQVS